MIRIETIRTLLMGQDDYIEEFANASIDSFGEFLRELQVHLPGRDLEAFRRVGHKIKPVAQMLEQESLLRDYEEAKERLSEAADDKALQESADRLTRHCEEVIARFREILKELQQSP